MQEMNCQDKMQTCAQWKSTMPTCYFGQIYKYYGNRKEVVFTLPAAQTYISSSTPTFLSTITGRFEGETDVETEPIPTSRSTTKDDFTVVRKLDTTNRYNTRIWEQEHVMVLSFGVGVFSFLIGMIIVYLLCWRRKYERKKETARESVFLLNIGENTETLEDRNVEQIEMNEFQSCGQQLEFTEGKIRHSTLSNQSINSMEERIPGIGKRHSSEVSDCTTKDNSTFQNCYTDMPCSSKD
uniref:Uncharacterized protein LOC111109731 n=1 Tax=Crassostrea virginica TaxID=6565 RepID=A0A8B8BEK9_CRAVI|nr:uncharacterized protein LOC111109731 [Crassostrea virginica]